MLSVTQVHYQVNAELHREECDNESVADWPVKRHQKIALYRLQRTFLEKNRKNDFYKGRVRRGRGSMLRGSFL